MMSQEIGWLIATGSSFSLSDLSATVGTEWNWHNSNGVSQAKAMFFQPSTSTKDTAKWHVWHSLAMFGCLGHWRLRRKGSVASGARAVEQAKLRKRSGAWQNALEHGKTWEKHGKNRWEWLGSFPWINGRIMVGSWQVSGGRSPGTLQAVRVPRAVILRSTWKDNIQQQLDII